MPDLPRIFAAPNIPFSGPQAQTTGHTYGAGTFETLADVFHVVKKQKDAEDLLAIQEAVDVRDQMYRDQALRAKLDPNTMGSLTADQFIKQFNDQAKTGDTEVLNQLSPKIRDTAALHLRRLQKTAFDTQFGDYRNTYVDQQQGKVIMRRDDLINKIASEPPGDKRDFYIGELNGSLDGAQAAGIFGAKDIANMKRDVNSDIEAVQVNSQMLNKQSGGPQQALADLQSGSYPNLKPGVREGLIANATRLARMNENEAAKNQRASQDGMFRVLSRLAEKGQLDQQTVMDHETDNTIRPDQARQLNGLAGAPTYAVSPGAVNDIMGERARHGLTLVANDIARRKLLKLDPRDPAVTSALNVLNTSDRVLRTPHGGAGSGVTQAVREFKDSPYSGNKTILQHFTLPGLQYQRSQTYQNAINHLEAEIGRGVPKEQAIKNAREMVLPKAGTRPTPGQSVQDYVGN